MKKIVTCLSLFFILFISSLSAQESASEQYVVEKFDTLWDISDTRLEDSFLWPKLWNVNPHIENPDLIYPGTKLLIPSREELMRMPDYPTKKMPIAKKRKSRKSLKPESQNTWRFAPTVRKKHIIRKNLYIASGWIADEFSSIGKIFHSPEDRQIVGRNDIVYIKLEDETTVGKRFMVVRDIKIVEHPSTGKKVGHQIRVPGIVEVIGKDGTMTKAKVTASYEDILMGDGLLPYTEMEAPLLPENARTRNVRGYIIESHMNTYLLGGGDIIFLDKGEKDGLEVGDVFALFADLPAERTIGEIQIVSLQPRTAGAVLIDSEQELTIGSQWGKKEE